MKLFALMPLMLFSFQVGATVVNGTEVKNKCSSISVSNCEACGCTVITPGTATAKCGPWTQISKCSSSTVDRKEKPKTQD